MKLQPRHQPAHRLHLRHRQPPHRRHQLRWLHLGLHQPGQHHDGGALYPSKGLTETYGASYPGTYRLEADASATFCDSGYSACYEIPLYANAVVAKYRTTTAVQITRSSTKGRWTTKVAAQVKRYDGYYDSSASGVTVKVYRDNKLFKTVKTNAAGTASASVADTKGAHTYKAVTAESGTAWSSTSSAVRK